MRKYALIDRATGDAIEAEADTVERVTGGEIIYIDWVLAQDKKFESGDWEVHRFRRTHYFRNICRRFDFVGQMSPSAPQEQSTIDEE